MVNAIVVVVAAALGGLVALPLVSLAERHLRFPRRFSRLTRWISCLGTAAVCAGVAAHFGPAWPTPAYLFFTGVALVLTLTDLAEKRLPNAVMYPSFAALLVLLAGAALITEAVPAILGALAGSVVAFAFYLVLRLISPRGIGMGDVKLAAVIGLMLGYLGWYPVVIGCAAGFVIGGLASAFSLARGSASLTSSIPFGPAMLSGAFVAIFLSRV
jgi:leader peptidase (prepilin peptidase)/N-methyltransferase